MEIASAATVVLVSVLPDRTLTPAYLVSLVEEEAVAATGTVARAHRLLELGMGAAAVMVDREVQVVPVAPLGQVVPMEAHWQRLVPLHPAVEVRVVQATVPAAEVVEDMEACPAAVQATLVVVLPEDTDHTVAVVGGPHLDAEVDIQVDLERATLLHKVVEGDIPMAPRRHRTVSHPPVAPATAKDTIPRLGPRIDGD